MAGGGGGMTSEKHTLLVLEMPRYDEELGSAIDRIEKDKSFSYTRQISIVSIGISISISIPWRRQSTTIRRHWNYSTMTKE